jgi:hypothetical protein
MQFRLGLRHAPRAPSRVLGAALSVLSAPAAVDWFTAAEKQTGVTICDGDALGNDTLSNCVPCGALRYEQIVRAIAKGDARSPTAAMATALYSRWSSWPAQDVGTDSAQAAILWATKGLQWDAQDEDVPSVMPLNAALADHLRAAVASLGPIQLDFAMPAAWQSIIGRAISEGHDITLSSIAGSWGQPGTWGNHRMCAAQYDAQCLYAVSWGLKVRITWDAVARYALAAWACVSRSWLDVTGASPAGLDLDTLAAEATALAA